MERGVALLIVFGWNSSDSAVASGWMGEGASGRSS